MDDRLNPVTLITGAATSLSKACVRDLARRSTGGLVLVDLDDSALSALADDLESQNAAPERMSMLALDVGDEERWAQAAEFIESQYGRLDWAVVNVALRLAQSELVHFGKKQSVCHAAALCLHAMMPLMRRNHQGGVVVLNGSPEAVRGAPVKTEFQHLLRAAAQEGAHDNIRVNGIAPGGADAPSWSKAPWFNDLVRDTGGARAAFDKISKMAAPMARYAGSDDISRLMVMLLTDDSPMTGATLVVDGGYTL